MSTQQTPLTYEGILELFLETREQMKETDRKIQEVAELQKRNEKAIGNLGSHIGEIVENMVAGKGNIVEKFQALGYDDIDSCYENRKFSNKKLRI